VAVEQAIEEWDVHDLEPRRFQQTRRRHKVSCATWRASENVAPGTRRR
jgi:hypothetical protein